MRVVSSSRSPPGSGSRGRKRLGEARGCLVYSADERSLVVDTYIWRDDDWGLTATRRFARGPEPLAQPVSDTEGLRNPLALALNWCLTHGVRHLFEPTRPWAAKRFASRGARCHDAHEHGGDHDGQDEAEHATDQQAAIRMRPSRSGQPSASGRHPGARAVRGRR